MSGSTMIRQQGRRYELRLETPSISFMPDPSRPDQPTHEQEYHANAARRFEEILAPLKGTLDDAVEAFLPEHPGVALLPFDGGLPLVHDRDRESSGPCRFSGHVGRPPDLNIGFDHGTLSLAFARLPEGGALERLFGAIAGAIWTILREHHLRQREAGRRGPVPSGPARFHYTRAADGTIEDLNGEAPGRPLAAERLAAPAALELCGSIAAIIAAAESDGVVHADLEASDIRIDGAEVSIDGFGEASSAKEAHPPEGNSNLFVPPGPRVDWTARQRYSLGHVIFQVLAGRALEVPRAEAADHDLAVARALAEIEPIAVRDLLSKLLAWTPARRPSAREARAVLAAAVEPAPPERRAPSKIPARLAADTRGILDRCRKCGRPALRHAGRNAGTANDYGPDCCWWERERRMLRVGGAILLAALAALIAWWVR